jgi:flagellar biogenesis protein FliO
MFQRVFYEDWQLVFPFVAFAAAVAFFCAVIWRAVRMQRRQLDRLARMPLEDEASIPDPPE